MQKGKVVPVVDAKDVEKHNETIHTLRELIEKNPKISVIGVIGPWLSRPYTERIEQYGGYQCGGPIAYIGIGVDDSLEGQYLNPLERDKTTKSIIEELHKKGISVSLTVTPMKDYDGTSMNPEQVLTHIFGPFRSEVTVVYRN